MRSSSTPAAVPRHQPPQCLPPRRRIRTRCRRCLMRLASPSPTLRTGTQTRRWAPPRRSWCPGTRGTQRWRWTRGASADLYLWECPWRCRHTRSRPGGSRERPAGASCPGCRAGGLSARQRPRLPGTLDLGYPGKRLRIGNKEVRPSHGLRATRGLHWCQRCGFHASVGADTQSRCRGLSEPADRQRRRAGTASGDWSAGCAPGVGVTPGQTARSHTSRQRCAGGAPGKLSLLTWS